METKEANPVAVEANPLAYEYINQLTVLERLAYDIAMEHLETSFDLEKSIGFVIWKKGLEKL
jgi:hypothetical protein